MSTTLTFRAIPSNYTGLTAVMGLNVAWRFSPWKILAPTTNSDMFLCGIDVKQDFISPTDDTHEQIFEIAFGKPGAETLRAQFPHSIRGDTSATHYMYAQLWLPEPILVPRGTIVSGRFACGQGGQYAFNGMKILVMTNGIPINPSEAGLPENYKNPSAAGASGISITEKTR